VAPVDVRIGALLAGPVTEPRERQLGTVDEHAECPARLVEEHLAFARAADDRIHASTLSTAGGAQLDRGVQEAHEHVFV